MTDLSAFKQRQQQSWAAGDFAMLGTTTVLTAELLCEAVDLRSGQKVLDVATGSGSTALAAARRGCEVTGIDFVPAVLGSARERARAERFEITFLEGDAENIRFPNASFDAVLSTYGAMFAPDQEKTASELLRVCRPGGKIGMANWTPDSFFGEGSRVRARYLPPPPGVKSPLLWGTEDRLRELFGDEIASLQITRRSMTMHSRSPRKNVEFARKYAGPFLEVFQTLDPAGQERLTRDLIEVIQRFNRSGDETMVVDSDYLEVVATKR